MTSLALAASGPRLRVWREQALAAYEAKDSRDFLAVATPAQARRPSRWYLPAACWIAGWSTGWS